jgi:hypothetical protein
MHSQLHLLALERHGKAQIGTMRTMLEILEAWK